MNYSEQDHDKSRDRKHEKQARKKIGRQREAICAIAWREAIRAIARTIEKEKITKKSPNL